MQATVLSELAVVAALTPDDNSGLSDGPPNEKPPFVVGRQHF